MSNKDSSSSSLSSSEGGTCGGTGSDWLIELCRLWPALKAGCDRVVLAEAPAPGDGREYGPRRGP
jgi:hypothetical protein